MILALAVLGGVLVALGLNWPRVTDQWRTWRARWRGAQAERATRERLRRRSDALRKRHDDPHRW